MSERQHDELGELLKDLMKIVTGRGVIVSLYHIDLGLNAAGALGIEAHITPEGKALPADKIAELRKLIDVGMAAFIKAAREAGIVDGAEVISGGPAIRAEEFSNKEEAPDASNEQAAGSTVAASAGE